MGRVLHRFSRSPHDLPIAGGWVLTIRACCSQNLASKLVVGSILFHLMANPGAEQFSSFVPKELAVALEQIRPLIGPKINVLRTANQTIDHRIALDPSFPRIIEESANIIG